MAQNNLVERGATQRYTRLDFAALRYRLNKLPLEFIIDRLFSEDTLLERGIETPAQLGHWLDDLKALLIDLAVKKNPYIAESLRNANRTGAWHKSAMSHLIEMGEKNFSYPLPTDQLAQWMRPRIAGALAEDGAQTVAQLKQLMEQRGRGWYRPVPRMGAGKAAAIERWLAANAEYLGVIQWPQELVPTKQLELTPNASAPWLPLDRIGSITHELDGSKGLNRNQAFCLISARNDLQAIHAFLYRYRAQPLTHRAYRKELERFLLWCVCVRRIALSSVLLDDCEAYKDFLADVPAVWCGNKAPRTSSRWRPFAGPLSAESQRYAIRTVRSCFEWLVRVRYLGGNPWVTVADPPVEQREHKLQIEKAIPQHAWNRLIAPDGWLDQACDRAQARAADQPMPAFGAFRSRSAAAIAAQYRLARAAILLLGLSGVRREEAAGATRRYLNPVHSQSTSPDKPPLWELAVLGKRSKWRTVYLPPRAIFALAEHWRDRGMDLFEPGETGRYAALLAPIIVPLTPTARKKHLAEEIGVATGAVQGFDVDALYQMTRSTLLRMARDTTLDLEPHERDILAQAAPHALRHTFATGAAAKDMPIDVLQKLLGHESVQTTSIYVQAEKQRSIDEVQKLFQG